MTSDNSLTFGPLKIVGPYLSFALVFLVLEVVYLLTMPPTITWEHHGADGGDLATAVVRGSIPHPPGFPTYVLLGELFVQLPWRDPTWRLNVMSATMAALAAALATMMIDCNLRSLTGGPLASFVAGLSLGLAPLLWSQALIVEVYALAAFISAGVMGLALRGGPAWALGLVWGVGMGVHPTLMLLAPMIVWGAWSEVAVEGQWRRLGEIGLTALVGWGTMYGPVLLARGRLFSPWADVSTVEGWWALVSGRIYRGYLFGLTSADWPRRIWAWLGMMVRQFTPLGAALAGLGWVYLWRERCALAAAVTLTFGMFSLYAIGYSTTDSHVYLTMVLPLMAPGLARGLGNVSSWLNRRWRYGARLILLLPMLQGLLFWQEMDVSQDRAAIAWAEQVLVEAPLRAVVVAEEDAHTFTLWYAHEVLGWRPDIVVIAESLWIRGAYRGMPGDMDGNLPLKEAAREAQRPVIRVD